MNNNNSIYNDKSNIVKNSEVPIYFQNNAPSYYSIEMKNTFIDLKTSQKRTSKLKSHYQRIIIENPKPQVAYCEYQFLETQYNTSNRDKAMTWSFARDFKFYHVLYVLKDKDLKEKYFEEAKTEFSVEPIKESFKKLPKLPSTYLLMMQVYDVIGLEAFGSLIISEDIPNLSYKKIDDFSNAEIDMKISENDLESSFDQSDFYVMGLGNTDNYKVYEYQAEPSTTKYMGSAENIKKNISLYSGIIVFDGKTDELIKATMKEVVVPILGGNEVSERTIVLSKEEGEFK